MASNEPTAPDLSDLSMEELEALVLKYLREWNWVSLQIVAAAMYGVQLRLGRYAARPQSPPGVQSELRSDRLVTFQIEQAVDLASRIEAIFVTMVALDALMLPDKGTGI